MTKRLISLFLLAGLLTGMLPLGAAAQETEPTISAVQAEEIADTTECTVAEEIADTTECTIAEEIEETTECTVAEEIEETTECTVTEEVEETAAVMEDEGELTLDNIEIMEGDSILEYAASSSIFKETESNDTYAKADKIDTGKIAQGKIRKADKDIYTLTVYGRRRIIVAAISEKRSFDIELQNSSGIKISGRVSVDQRTNGWGFAFDLIVDPGTYYIVCTDSNSIYSYDYYLEYSLRSAPCAAHTYAQTVTSPTCGTPGQIIDTCTACGHKQITNYSPATGKHTFGSWKTTQEPTCSQQGIQTRTCSGCNAKEQKNLPKSNVHIYGNWTTDRSPTCTQDGTQVRKCTNCSKQESSVLKALGHSYSCTRCNLMGDPYTGNHSGGRILVNNGNKEFTVVNNNGNEAYADMIYSGYTMKGYLGSSMGSSNRHCFKFVLEKDTKIDILALADHNGSTMSLFDASENLVACDIGGKYYNGNYAYIISGYLPKGTYYIAMLNRSSYGMNYALSLEVEYESTASCEEIGHNYSCIRCSHVAGKILRISGEDRMLTAFQTANQLKKILGIEKFNAIIISCGNNFADALAGSYLAASKKAPILLSLDKTSSHNQNLQYIQENLSETGIVYILGGTSAVSQNMEDLLIRSDISCKRLMGENRYETNIEILKEVGIHNDEILVATGLNFADSLSASATGLPILLVNTSRNTLNAAQKAYLEEITAQGSKRFTIIGGTGAVSDALKAQLEAYGSVRRISGSTREHTSVKVAESFFRSPNAAVLAYSRNFPDGLCGGPLAYALNAPLLLVNRGSESYAATYVRSNGISEGYVLGGHNALSNLTVDLALNP